MSFLVSNTRKGEEILQFNGKPFHSRVSPSREAESILKKDLKAQDIDELPFIAIIYGTELGYLTKELSKNKNCLKKLIITGPEKLGYENSWRESLSKEDQIFNDLHDAIRSIKSDIESFSLIETGALKLLRCFHPSYSLVNPEELKLFCEAFYALYSKFLSTKETYENKYKLWYENARNNLLAEKSGERKNLIAATELKVADKKVLLLGAGISLDRKIRKLKKFRNEYIILASDSLFPKLQIEAIEADYYFTCETEALNLSFFNDKQVEKSSLVMDCIASSEFLKLKFKNIFLFAGKESPVIKRLQENGDLKHDLPELPYSGSIGNAMLAAAINFFKADIIETLGIDSGFLGGRAYAVNTYNESLHLRNIDGELKVFVGPDARNERAYDQNKKVIEKPAKIWGDTFHQTPEFIHYGDWIDNAKRTLEQYKEKKIILREFEY